MAFDSLYAATPGRPVNIRRDIGEALIQAPELPVPDWRERATAAASSIAAGIDPRTTSGPVQFLGGVARGFAGVQQYLQAVTGQKQDAARQDEQRRVDAEERERRRQREDLQDDNIRSQIRERDEPPRASTPAADNWELMPGEPGSPQVQRNRRTGQTRTVLGPDRRPILYPRRGGGGTTNPPPASGATITPEQAQAILDQIARENPDWSDEQVAAEARRRAAAPPTPRVRR